MEKIDEEVLDVMKSKNSIVEHYEKQISILFSLDSQKIQSLIDTLNDYGADLSVNKLADITGLSSTRGTAFLFRDALISLIHYLFEHNEDLVKDFDDSKFGKQGFDKIKTIFEKFSQKTIDGFNLRFYMGLRQSEFTLESLRSETILREIIDENHKTCGHVPILQVRLDIYDSFKNKSVPIKIEFELEECNAFIKGLQNMRDDFLDSAKTYKEKFGKDVVVTGD